MQQSPKQWQELVNLVYAPARNRMLTDEPFSGSLLVKPLGQAELTAIRSSPIEYDRRLGADRRDHFYISLTLCPEAYVTQRGRSSRQRSGDIVLLDSAQPYLYRLPQGGNQIVCKVPRALFLAHVPQAQNKLGFTLDSRSALGKLAGALITGAWEAETQPYPIGEKLVASLLDVVNTAFEAALGESAPAAPASASPRQDTFGRACQFMRTRLHDSSLTVDQVALAVHVSTRTLNRVFAGEGSSAMRWLWRQRLDACHAGLRERRFRNVGEAALSCGFTNLAHFSRAFRAAYGLSPRQLMRQPAQAARGEDGAAGIFPVAPGKAAVRARRDKGP